MKGIAVLATLAFVGLSVGQGVTDKIPPKGEAPDGCKPAFDGLFQVTVEDVTTVHAKRDLTRYQKRGASCAADGTLVVSLADGVLTDAKDRTGYIASNRQFQFDGPPQAGAIYTAGFSVCGNGSLALGSSAVFYECLSGDFYNLYDEHWAPQCSPVEIVAIPCGGPDPPYASQIPDGQVIGTTVVATTVVIPLSDGQPQVITTTVPVPLCQIGDGQVQGKTVPCASVTVKPTSEPVPVSQFSDGQIQVTPPGTAAPPPPVTVTSETPVTTAAPPPVTSAVPPPLGSANGTTTFAKTTSAPAVSVPSSSAAASSSQPASPPASGAGNLQMSSLAALVVGIVGAVCFL